MRAILDEVTIERDDAATVVRLMQGATNCVGVTNEIIAIDRDDRENTIDVIPARRRGRPDNADSLLAAVEGNAVCVRRPRPLPRRLP